MTGFGLTVWLLGRRYRTYPCDELPQVTYRHFHPLYRCAESSRDLCIVARFCLPLSYRLTSGR
jgi:hypothetical protein